MNKEKQEKIAKYARRKRARDMRAAGKIMRKYLIGAINRPSDVWTAMQNDIADAIERGRSQ